MFSLFFFFFALSPQMWPLFLLAVVKMLIPGSLLKPMETEFWVWGPEVQFHLAPWIIVLTAVRVKNRSTRAHCAHGQCWTGAQEKVLGCVV